MNTATPSELSPITPGEQIRPAGYPTLSQVWWLVVVFFLAQLPAALPAIGFQMAADHWAIPILKPIGETLAYMIALGLTILYGFRQRSSRALSWAAAPVNAYWVSVVGLLALNTLTEPFVSAIPMPAPLQELINKFFSKDILISAIIAAPILEEILFRGIILDGLLKNYRPAKAIIWSGVIFGGIHLIPAQALNAMFIGIAVGWLYYRTRSLWLCMFLHFVNNGLSSLVFLFDDTMDMSQNLTRIWVDNDLFYSGLLLGCAGICWACYAYLNRILPKPVIN